MESFVLAHEPALRLAAFAAVLAIMAGWEIAAPRRNPALARRRRWPANLGIAVLNTLLVRLLFPAAALGMALAAQSEGWGLLNRYEVPAWAAVLGGPAVACDAAAVPGVAPGAGAPGRGVGPGASRPPRGRRRGRGATARAPARHGTSHAAGRWQGREGRRRRAPPPRPGPRSDV